MSNNYGLFVKLTKVQLTKIKLFIISTIIIFIVKLTYYINFFVDCQDYIFTILLNSVLLPSARFSADGNTKKKATIKDANESFVLQLTTISDYSRRIKELIGKYYYNKLTVQPFVIVVGDSVDDLKTFYIYFDETLYKLNSFIESLDTCFKIFHVFNLKYPKICEMPWMFIQKYFYELDSKFDAKSSNLTSLLTHMNEKI